MKCPKEKRECPNGWTDCSLCAFKKKCDDGTYVPELEDNELETDLGIVISEVVEPVREEKPKETWRGSWHEHVMSLSSDEALKEFYSKHPPSLHDKEPIPAGNGLPGGGSKNKVKKSNKGTKVFVDPWEGI